MNQRPTQFTRFHVMSALALAALGVYLVVLFNIQVVHHEDYLALSNQTITRVENVTASRGIITGQTLVSNQYAYSLTFDTSLLKSGTNQNDAILRLVQLCRDQNVEWDDNLPLSYSTPFTFTVDDLTNTQKGYFFGFLRSLKPAQDMIENFVKSHPELMKPAKTDDAAQAEGENTADTDDASTPKAPDLDNFDTAQLTSALLLRNTRNSVVDITRMDYVDFARSKGITSGEVRTRHVMRNAMISTVTLLSMRMAAMLGGSVIIETVFSVPGIGKLASDAIFGRDYAVVQYVVLLFAVLVLVINLITDILYSFLDPRVNL